MIKLINVSKAFPKKRIFENLNIQFENGNLYGIYGPSGCGKTTLLNMVSMLDFSYDGTIEIDDIEINDVPKKEDFRNTYFSYIFSKPMLLEYLNVKENALLPLSMQKRKIPQNFNKYVEYLGIKEILDKNVDQISEGEKQRVSVLRALLIEKEHLIADEPTSHLDHENSIRLVEKLNEIAFKENKVVLLTCHDDSLLPYFDKAYKIEDETLHEIHSI